jgi:hypothetical protein
MWVTKKARFNAASRFEFLGRLSTLCITVLSLYVILLSVMPLVFTAQWMNKINAFNNVANIVVSVFIIAFSIMEGSRNHPLRAMMMRLSALEIAEHEDILAGKESEVDEAAAIAYHRILQKFAENHGEIDFLKVQLERPEEFKLSVLSLCRLHLRHTLLAAVDKGIYIVAMALPIVAVLVGWYWLLR